MKPITMDQAVSECLELEVAFININGYYSNKDDQQQLKKHTYVTQKLFSEAFNRTTPSRLTPEDYFEGVCFDKDNTPLAEWFVDGAEEYIKINLKEGANTNE